MNRFHNTMTAWGVISILLLIAALVIVLLINKTTENMAIGSHQSAAAKTHEYITPQYILDALGPFDLDPCAAVNQPWPTAHKTYTVNDDGLSKQWFGRVWLNPPYGKHLIRWMLKLSQHGDGIALIPARTETKAFFGTVWESKTVSGILFMRGRITFCKTDGRLHKGNSGAPPVLIAYGAINAAILKRCGLNGKFIQL